jgi:GT2 family glycosyltransferase
MHGISIIIVNFNTADYLRECLTSVFKHCLKAEVIVVDNASADNSCAMVKTEFPQVKLIESAQNLGFGLGNNLGVQNATQPFVMLLNSDAYLQSDTASALVDYLEAHPQVACVAPRVVLPISSSIQAKTFGFSPTLKRIVMQSLGLNRLFPKSHFFTGIDGDYRWQTEMQVGWVSGVCMVMRTADYLAVGGFDKRFFMYCEDIDLCVKLEKLGNIMLIDAYDVVHYGGASSKSVAAKVRNSVWQQRNLLTILRDYRGLVAYVLSCVVIAVGLVARLFAGIFSIPKKGFKENITLLSAWARLKDIMFLNALKGQA